MKTELLKYGHFYHIYNRGIDSCNLFRKPENYEYFLVQYDKYISPIADTYAWVLMPNHFHLLVRVKDEEEIRCGGARNLTGFKNLSGLNTTTGGCNPDGDYEGLPNLSDLKSPHQHFSNLFNAYSKAFNKRFDRHGSLFERPFKRKLIDNEKYLKHVILYIHNNPVHHGFCSHPVEYSWTSYLSCISIKPTRLKREAVYGWFDDQANFKVKHDEIIKIEWIEKMEKWLGFND